jgi:hypothetical protein
LDISGNGLQGAMPDSLCGLTRLQTLYLSSPTQAHANENSFSCVPQCFYLNPNDITLHYDFALPYCGQTDSPTLSPTLPVQAKSTDTGAFTASEMGGLIGGIFIFVVFCLFVLYYFTCYANTSVRKKDAEFMTSTSYIDVDSLRKNRLVSVQSSGGFDEGSVSGFSDSDSEEGGETRHEIQGNRLRHKPAVSNDNSLGSDDDDDEMMKAWNIDLVDYQNSNREVLVRNLSSFGCPVGEESSDDGDDDGDNQSRTEKNTHTADNSNSEYLSDNRRVGLDRPGSSRQRSSRSLGRSGSGNSGKRSDSWHGSFDTQGDFFDDEGIQSDVYELKNDKQDTGRSDVYHSDGEEKDDIDDDDSPYREKLDSSF